MTATVPTLTRAPASRLLSLDAFRGFTIASMMLVNNAGDWSAVYPPLLHAQWHGWTFTDLVFPFFLWIAGVSMTLSFARRIERGDSRTSLLAHTSRRAASIFAIGLFLNAFPYFDLATLRIPGVLQRIAICYLAAAVIYLFAGWRGQIVAALGLMGIYWAFMMLVPVPGYGAGVLERQGNFAQYIDQMFLEGHMYAVTKTWDPEGIVSTLPAIATTLFGVLAGHLLRMALSAGAKAAWLLGVGIVLMLGGLALDPLLPINKNLWTSTYTLFTAGLAGIVFGTCYWLIDVRGSKRWAQPLAIYGMNPIVVYALASMLADILSMTGFGKTLYRTAFLPLASPVNASLLYALAHVALYFWVAWFMHRKNWVIRL